jgi:hypothetical protein
MVLGLARSDDEGRGELDLAEQVTVLEGHVELVVHVTLSSSAIIRF